MIFFLYFNDICFKLHKAEAYSEVWNLIKKALQYYYRPNDIKLKRNLFRTVQIETWERMKRETISILR